MEQQPQPQMEDCRDFPVMDHSDDMSEVTLSTIGSSKSDKKKKNPVSESRKWGLLWKTKSPLQTAKKLKKTMKKKIIRKDSREEQSPEMMDTTIATSTIVEENSKSWGVHFLSTKSKSNKSSFFEGVLEEEDDGEVPDDEVPGRHHHHLETSEEEEITRSLQELNEKFRNQEKVDEYHLCRLELQEKNLNGRTLSAEEVYELSLLERHASGEKLYAEVNDLDDFVEKRMLYKRLQIDLADMRSQQLKGEQIDEDLLFVLELFEKRRTGQPLFTMEKLALDLLTRDRLGDTLTDAEMDELIDIMDLLRDKKNSAVTVSTTTPETNATPSGSNSSLMIEVDGAELEDSDATPGLDPWSNGASDDEVRNDVDKEHTAVTAAGGEGGWLTYWRSNHEQQDAEKTRDKIQKELLDKAILKAELLMEIDNLKTDLKKANASVLELGGEADETTKVILNEGGLPDESMPEQPSLISSESLQLVRSECEELVDLNEDKESKIASLEAQVRELRAKTVTSARKGGSKWGKKVEDQDSETISQLSAECAQLKEQLKEVNKKYEESRESHENTCARLEELQDELDQCSEDLQAARDELKIREKEIQTAAFEFSALNVRYKAASSKIERLEEEYPESIKERVEELLEEAGKTGGVDILVDCYESAVATIGALEEKLESAEEKTSNSEKLQTEYNRAVQMSKELEKDVERLQSKLKGAQSEYSKAQEEKFRVSDEIEEVRLKMEDLEVKLMSAEKEAAAANKRQAEYSESVENNKKLEHDMAELQIKLEAAQSEVTTAHDEKQRVTNEIEAVIMKMKDLEAKLKGAEGEVAAANECQADFDDAVAMCKKLEKESEELQCKLKAVELEAAKATEEKNRAYEAIAEAKLQITDVGAKLRATEEENAAVANKKQADYENAIELSKLLEENAKELQSKLATAESEASDAKRERENVLVQIATMRVQIRSLEAKLESAEEEAATANEKQAEYDAAVKMCKKLEDDVGDLQSKLEAAEAKVTKATEEMKIISEQAATETKLKMAEHEKKINALAQQVQYLEGENFKLLEENVELKELCEEMIAGIGDDALDC